MPTPRAHGGAALQNIPLTTPAFKGLNTQASKSLLTPEWATVLKNSVLDINNRVAARNGFQTLTTGTKLPATIAFVQLVEYRKLDGTIELVGSATNDKMYKSLDDGASWTDVTGAATITDNNVQFQNFNNKLIAFQDGGAPLVYTGTTFSNIADVNAPQGRAGLAAFGRLWGVDANGVDLKYCALLDETDWTSLDNAGVLSMENVWPESDSIVACAAFNGALVVMGYNNIIMWTDGAGSPIGIDPATAYVVDTITGLGCVARDTVQNVKGDLWFLSRDGVQSLARLVQEKSNPIQNLSSNIQDVLINNMSNALLDLNNARTVYSPEDRFYLLSLPQPTGSPGSYTENGNCYAFDTRGYLEDGTARVMGIWTRLVPQAIVCRRDRTVVMAISTSPRVVGQYAGYADEDTDGVGRSFNFDYESGWIDITDRQGYQLILKNLDTIMFVGQDGTITLKWAFDFNSGFRTRPLTYVDVAGFSLYGVSEYGIDSWNGGAALVEQRANASGVGEYIKVGATATIETGPLAIQQLDIFAKIGRLK